MKFHTWTPWRFAAFISIAMSCSLAKAGVLDSCWKASTQTKSVEQSSLFEEDGRHYFSFDGLEFGVKEDGESGYIKINDIDVDVGDIKVVRRESRDKKINLGVKDLNMLQGEVVLIWFKSKAVFCLTLPFSGLGASGNFAKYKAVIAIPKAAKRDADIAGIVGKTASYK